MKRILICFLVGVVGLLVVGCGNDKLDLGYVDEENVDILLRDFNNEIANNSGFGFTSSERNIVDGDYHYEITEGISLVVVSKENDIVSEMIIYVDKEYIDDPQVLAYTRLLIAANNQNITWDEAQNLIDEAMKNDINSNNKKGISVGYEEKNDHYEFRVIRNYK